MDVKATIRQLFDLTRTVLEETSAPKVAATPRRGSGLAEIGKLRREAGIGPWQPMQDIDAILSPQPAASGPFAWGGIPRSESPPPWEPARTEARPPDPPPPPEPPPRADPQESAESPPEPPLPEELPLRADADDPAAPPFHADADDPAAPTPAPPATDSTSASPPDEERPPILDAEIIEPVEVAAADPEPPLEERVKAMAESQAEAAAALHADNLAAARTLYARSLGEAAREDGPPALWLFAATSLLGLVHCEPSRASAHARAALSWARRHHAKMPSEASLELLMKAATVLAARAAPQDLASGLQDAIAALEPERDDPLVAKVLGGLRLQLASRGNPFRPGISSGSFLSTVAGERHVG